MCFVSSYLDYIFFVSNSSLTPQILCLPQLRMGESGAGKTTLMDVIALRKGSGKITGDVLLNGFPQESISFRRCSGYVEQFGKCSASASVITH